MMIYALVHYPEVDVRRINQIRRQYDPQFNLIAPHVTLMFPVVETIGEVNLVSHLERVLSRWQPFSIHLQGFEKSWDDYLFLLIQEGNIEIARLHAEIYTGVLSSCRTAEQTFIPHLTLGRFAENADQYAEALRAAEGLNLDYHCTLDKLHLIKVNADRSRIVWSKEFALLT